MLNVVQNLISCGSQLLVPFFASVDQSGARVSIKKKFSEWAIKKRKEKRKKKRTQRNGQYGDDPFCSVRKKNRSSEIELRK